MLGYSSYRNNVCKRVIRIIELSNKKYINLINTLLYIIFIISINKFYFVQL